MGVKGRLRTGVYAETHPFASGPLYLQDVVSLHPLLPALKCTGNKRPPPLSSMEHRVVAQEPEAQSPPASQRAVPAGGTYAPAHTVPSVTYVWRPGASGPHREDLELLTPVRGSGGEPPGCKGWAITSSTQKCPLGTQTHLPRPSRASDFASTLLVLKSSDTKRMKRV